ncbi:hypothetical protein GCM10027073_67670 [Streptomyces chlorus]
MRSDSFGAAAAESLSLPAIKDTAAPEKRAVDADGRGGALGCQGVAGGDADRHRARAADGEHAGRVEFLDGPFDLCREARQPHVLPEGHAHGEGFRAARGGVRAGGVPLAVRGPVRRRTHAFAAGAPMRASALTSAMWPPLRLGLRRARKAALRVAAFK